MITTFDDMWYHEATDSEHVLWVKHEMNFRCPCGNHMVVEQEPRECKMCGRVYRLDTSLQCADPLDDQTLVEDSDLLLDWATRAYLQMYTPRYIVDHCRLFGNEQRAAELEILFRAAAARKRAKEAT